MKAGLPPLRLRACFYLIHHSGENENPAPGLDKLDARFRGNAGGTIQQRAVNQTPSPSCSDSLHQPEGHDVGSCGECYELPAAN